MEWVCFPTSYTSNRFPLTVNEFQSWTLRAGFPLFYNEEDYAHRVAGCSHIEDAVPVVIQNFQSLEPEFDQAESNHSVELCWTHNPIHLKGVATVLQLTNKCCNAEKKPVG